MALHVREMVRASPSLLYKKDINIELDRACFLDWLKPQGSKKITRSGGRTLDPRIFTVA